MKLKKLKLKKSAIVDLTDQEKKELKGGCSLVVSRTYACSPTSVGGYCNWTSQWGNCWC